MLHNIVFVGLVVLLAFSFPLGIEPAFYDPAICLGGAVAVVVLSALSGALASRLGARLRTASRPGSRPLSPLRALANPPVLARGFVLLWFALLVYGLNWPLYVQYTLGLSETVAAEKLFTLLPAVIALMASIACSYAGERGRKAPGFTFPGYLAFQARMFIGCALLPVLGILVAFDVLEAIPIVAENLQIYTSLYFVASVILLFGAYSFAPLILRVAFRTRPLEAWLEARSSSCQSSLSVGQTDHGGTNVSPWSNMTKPVGNCLAEEPSGITARLRSLCQRLGMPNMRFLVWETGDARVANAGMVGLLGEFRYVLLSDTLFEILTPDELVAVVGHELGHAKNKHLLYYFVAALLFMILGHFAFGLLATLGTPPTVQFLFSAVFVLVFWKAVLGGLSRVFECQADLEGVRAASSPVPFTSAMEKIAAAAQIDQQAANWLYRSVSARIAFVWSAFYMPDEESRFRATLKRIHSRIKQISVLAALGLIWMFVGDINEGGKRRTEIERIRFANAHYRVGCTHYSHREFERAAREFHRAVSLIPRWPPYKIALADTLRELGLLRVAWETWLSAARDEPAHPFHRIGLRKVKEALLATGPGVF
jgi:Zn-dependent protease with chaperone function